MEDKITAVYVMVRQDELKPEDNGNYDRPLQEQREALLGFLKEKCGDDCGPVEVYTRRGHLLTDIERDRIARLVILGTDRLGWSPDEVDGVMYELTSRKVEILSAQG